VSGEDFMPDTSNQEQSDAQALSLGCATRAGSMRQP
jgi:hypothetical protein